MATDIEMESWSLPRPLKAAIALGIVYCAWLLFAFQPLPIADLPQHEAQLTLYRALGDPTFPFADQYEINYFTPYLLAYLVADAFALVLPIDVAFKATLFIALLAFIYAIYRFQRRMAGEPWWILFGFPLFFGLSFVWGFLNFMMAIPLILVAIELSYAYGGDPGWRKGLPLALVGVLAFFAHGMACAFGMALGGAVAAARSGAWRSPARLLRLLPPYLPAAALVLSWRLFNPELELWLSWHLLSERLSMHRRLLGDHMDVEAMFWSVPFLAVVFFAVLINRKRWAEWTWPERWARGLPLGAILLYTTVMPDQIGTLYHANGRFLIFVPLFAGWCVARRSWKLAPLLIGVLSFGWLAILGGRFAAVEEELRPLLPMLDQLPARGKLLAIRVSQDQNAFAVPMVIHQPAWYTVRREGQVDFSFAAFQTELVRYVPGRKPEIPQGFEHHPWAYDNFALAGDYYDFWLIYAPPDAEVTLPPERFRLRDRTVFWRLYELRRAPEYLERAPDAGG